MKRIAPYIIICVCSWITNSIHAQTLKASIDRDKILLGEQIKLSLEIENVANTHGWFNLPDSFNHIEVVERGKIDTMHLGNVINFRQTVMLTSFDSGVWQIPALQVAAIDQATKPMTVQVLPVDVSHLKDYHDIKEIVEVDPVFPWMFILWVAIGVLLVAILIYVLYKLGQRRNRRPKLSTTNKSPLQWAMEELDKLEQEKLYDNNRLKEHYTRLVEVGRQFFNVSLGQQSLHKTTDEWMLQLQYLQVNAQEKTAFFQLLRLADAVKFARYTPPAEENKSSVNDTRQMIVAVSEFYKNIQSPTPPSV